MKTLKTKTVALASVLLGLTLSAGSQNNPLPHHVNDRYVIAHIKWSASPRVATEEEPLKMVLGVFDPGSTGTVVSAWIRHYGLIDQRQFRRCDVEEHSFLNKQRRGGAGPPHQLHLQLWGSRHH